MAKYKNYTAGMNLVIQENGEDVYYRFGEANFNGSNGSKFKIAPNFHVINQDMYSTTIRVFLDWVSLGYSGSGGRVYGYINGIQLENSYTSISANQSRYMGCQDITIYHSDTTGQGAVNVNCKVDTPWSLGDAESNTTIYSNTWPRASEPTASSVYIGNDLRINTNRKSSAFTHSITVSFGNFTRSWSNVGDYVDWHTSENVDSLYAQIPNSPNGVGTVSCTTYNGNTQIGNIKQCSFTLTANKDLVKPIVVVEAIDTNKTLETGNTIQNLTGDSTNKTIIKGISNVQVGLTATARGSSSISATQISASTGEYSNNSGNFNYTFNNVLTDSFIGKAVDSRNYEEIGYVNDLTMLDYTQLSISPVRLYRENQTSNELYAEIDGNYFNGSFNNTANVLTLSFKYKESSSDTWSSWQALTPTISQNDNKYSFDGLLGSNFDYTKIYDFVFKVEDLAMIQTNEVSSTPGIPIIGIFEDFIELWGEVFVYK